MKPLGKFRKTPVFLREVAKPVAFAFVAVVVIGFFVYVYFEDPALPYIIIAALILIALVLKGSWTEFQIEVRLEQMRYLGRAAARIGRPPDFYKKDQLDIDMADEIAIMQGWDLGWEEFQSLPEQEQAILRDANKADGYIDF